MYRQKLCQPVKSKAKNNQSIVLYNKNYDWRVEMGRQATHFPAVLKSPVT
jgi:hypothetical protein